ncbi:MAG TPA: pseudouridine synthase [Candidatus Koribacter sp.]|jgi:23S rRNA pseudouridine2605 synthase
MSEERLQKIIAAAGVASRRKAEELITAGRVTVNGEVKNELGSKADPATDDIRVDGKGLKPEEHVYVLLHKPKGYVTTVTDPEGRPTVMDLVKSIPARVYPVGRLDYLSEGLLLLTNDGEIAAKLTHASTHVPKKYLVKVSGEPTEEQVQQLRDGVQLPAEQGNIHADPREGGRFGGEKRRSTAVKTAPCKIDLTREGDNPWYEVTLTEGRNRQIRRMFDFIGHHVEKIKRVEYGPLKLDVENGEFRLLNPAEVARLKQASEGRHAPPRARDERPRFDKPRKDRGSRGERPAFSGSPRRADFARRGAERGSYKDRSDVEDPRGERTRTARFNADGKREEEAPRERRERPKFDRRDKPAFRGRRDDSRGERPAFRARPDDRPERPKFGKPREGGSRPSFGDRPKFASSGSRPERPFRGKPAAGGESGRKNFGRPPARGGSRPFSGKPKFGDRKERSDRPRFDRGAPRGEGRNDRPPFDRGASGGEERPKRPFRAKPGDRKEFRGKREDRPAFRGPRKEGDFRGDRPKTGDRKPGGFRGDRAKSGDRPFRDKPFGKKPGGFRKDFRPRRDDNVPDREEPKSQEFVDNNVAKRFSGKLESGGRGPRRGPGGGAKKGGFRKPKDRR